MFNNKLFKPILILFCLITISSCLDSKQKTEQKPEKRWVKGNLHAHTYWSDGDEFPEVVLDWYKKNGYQFITLSDHNVLAEGEKWIKIPEDSLYQNAFKSYLKNYGSDWVTHKIDSGQIHVKLKTYNEYKERYEEDGIFIVIQSEEISDRFENIPIHVNATNIQTRIEPQSGASVLEVLQNNIDAVIKQRAETGVPMIPHINHPNFYYSISLEDIIALRGERFFEVYNGHPMVKNLGDSIHISTEEMWDLINISYLKNKQPLMYGLATDDTHNYHLKGSKWSNAGRGWIMVRTKTLTPEALIANMEAGQFYATTGVTLKELEFDDNILFVEVEQEEGITYTISFLGCKKGKTTPEVFKTVNGAEASFTLTDDILFVRSKITSTKLHSNPIEAILYEMAWTQPVIKTE